MRTVTFDSTETGRAIVLETVHAGWHVAFSSVSLREAHGTDFEVALRAYERVPELAVWDEGSWDEAHWGDEPSSERIDKILTIVSNGSFPKNRDHLSKGHVHQLRDAIILEAHSAAKRMVFVTNDTTAFIKYGRREKLEALLATRILTRAEFEAELGTL